MYSTAPNVNDASQTLENPTFGHLQLRGESHRA